MKFLPGAVMPRRNERTVPAPPGFYGCPICRTVKPNSEFPAAKRGPDGHCSICKECKRADRKARRAAFTWNISMKDETRFWLKTAEAANGCIEFQGKSRDKNGYGFFFVNGRQLGAHRIAWALEGNEVPDWPLVIDHMCKNVLCVNVAHLRVVHQNDNVNKYADRSQSGAKLKSWWDTIPAEERSRIARERWERRRAKLDGTA